MIIRCSTLFRRIAAILPQKPFYNANETPGINQTQKAVYSESAAVLLSADDKTSLWQAYDNESSFFKAL